MRRQPRRSDCLDEGISNDDTKGIEKLKRALIWLLAGFGFVCLVLIVLNLWYDYIQLKSISEAQCSSKNTSDVEDADIWNDIERLVEFARKSVRKDMTGYPYPNGKYNISATLKIVTVVAAEVRLREKLRWNLLPGLQPNGSSENEKPTIILKMNRSAAILAANSNAAFRGVLLQRPQRKLEDLLINENGRPIRSIVLSTWRSGSTFFGEILGVNPGSFYFFEPLVHHDSVQIRGPPLASPALKHIKALLNCEFAGLDEYIKFVENLAGGKLFNKTTYLWGRCKDRNGTCFDHRYLSSLCKLFPFQSMKLLRLRLSVSRELLADEKLGVRMVLSVRDPRGTMLSRKYRSWCPRSRDCIDPALYCADLVSDYKIAVELTKEYPQQFRVIRYEDLSTNPYKEVEDIFKFYGREFDTKVTEFLSTHTTKNVGGPHGTFRDSKSTPFHWKTDLTFEEIEEIQRTCAVAMELWGYVPARNATHLREFSPLTDYNVR